MSKRRNQAGLEYRTARIVGLGLVVDYLEQWRTFPTGPNVGTWSDLLGLSIFLGKVRL